MDCLIEEMKTLKKFKREHPKVKKYDDKKPKKEKSKESFPEKMARLRALKGKK